MSEQAEGLGTELRGSDPAKQVVPRWKRLRPREISWLIATPIGLVLLAILATRPVGPDLASNATPVPGATFYVLGAETAGLQVGQRAPRFHWERQRSGASSHRSRRKTGRDHRPSRATRSGLSSGRPGVHPVSARRPTSGQPMRPIEHRFSRSWRSASRSRQTPCATS